MAVKFTKPEINVREKLAELDKPSGIAGEAMLRAETPQEQQALLGVGRKRMNANGDMRVWQRGNQSSTISTRAADRYLIQITGMGTVGATIDTDVPKVGGFSKSLKIACTATGTLETAANLMLIHRMEGQDSQCTNYGTTNPEYLTLSFWIKSNKAGAISVNFENEDTSVVTGGSSADQGYQTKQYINSPETWEYKTVTIEGDPYSPFAFNKNKGLCFEIVLSSASTTYDTGTPSAQWSLLNNNQRSVHNDHYFGASTSNYYKITGIQLELGKVATAFEHRSYGEELALCQRYFYKAPSSNGYLYSMLGVHATLGEIQYYPPVTMRTAPSVSLHDASPYWEVFPWNTVGNDSIHITSIHSGHMSPDGHGQVGVFFSGTTGSYVTPNLVRGLNYVIRADFISFEADL